MTNATAVADLLIVDVSFDQLATDVDFSETRLAGLIRQHSKSQFIFTLEVGSHRREECVD